MERDWVRLGSALRAARETLGPSQAQMGARIGVGRDAVRDIEAGRPKRLTATIHAYGREVGWTEESVDAVLRGGDPTPASTGNSSTNNDSAEVVPHYADGMPSRIGVRLSAGRVFDTDIIDLTATPSGAPLVMVAMDPPDGASEEEMAAYVRRWTRIQRAVREIVDEERPNP